MVQSQLEREDADRQMHDAMESTRDKMVGEVISSTLNFLANQRQMLLHESRISKIAAHAGKLRDNRESKESGTRQARQKHLKVVETCFLNTKIPKTCILEVFFKLKL